MTTWTALTTVAGKATAEALGAAMERLDPSPMGVGVFEIEDGSGTWEVGGYFTDEPDQSGLALLTIVHGSAEFAVSEIPDKDWVAEVRRELTPVEAGRFFVHGAHDADKLPEDLIGLRIEAAMAFGTGHHGTTKGCLLALDWLADKDFSPSTVADIGCGTAVLAMASHRLWPVPTVASDIDQVAIEVAEANLRANGLEDQITCVEAAGFESDQLGQLAPYDLVFANILMGPLVELAPAMAKNVAIRGFLIISGILEHQAGEVGSKYIENGFSVVRQTQIGDWTTTILTRNLS